VTASDAAPFREALEPYGDWLEDARYGIVWVPSGTPAGWRPYTAGRWLSTNHGWMWLEEEPWGWAAYHYGRWTLDEDRGWAWIPGPAWAPAWVAWRNGQGYVGWAPLPLEVNWKGSEALSRGVDAFAWSFLRAKDFTSQKVAPKVVPAGRNVTLLSITRDAARYERVGPRVAERGFSESGAVKPATRHRVVDAAAHRQNRAPVLQGSTVEVYRPEALKAQPSQDRESASPRPSGRRASARSDRERREQGRFEELMSLERDRLRRDHERELRDPPVSEGELRKRHKAEVEAQERFERRERVLFEHRRNRLRD
jgi:hypothetical protein